MKNEIDKIKERIVSNGGIINGICIHCGNTGRTKDSLMECPFCGRKYSSNNINTREEDLAVTELSGIHIPNKYRSEKNSWNWTEIQNKLKLRLSRTTGKLHIPPRIFKFFSRVDAIYQQIKDNNIDCTTNQLFFCITKDFIDLMEIFAYSCMIAIIGNGYTTASIQSPTLFDVRRNEDLLKKDLLIFELGHTDLDNSIYKLEEICSIRSRFDRTTFVITSVSDVRIFRMDINASFDKILHEEDEKDIWDTSLIKVLKL